MSVSADARPSLLLLAHYTWYSTCALMVAILWSIQLGICIGFFGDAQRCWRSAYSREELVRHTRCTATREAFIISSAHHIAKIGVAMNVATVHCAISVALLEIALGFTFPPLMSL